MAQRCIIVYQQRGVMLADGSANTQFNLDAAMQRGAKIVEVHPLGGGAHLLNVLDDPGEKK